MVLTNIIGVQGDGFRFRVTVYSAGGLHFFVNNTLRQALGRPSFRAPPRNLRKVNAGLIGTDPESTFVASACEYGVAVQGDGLQHRGTVCASGRPFFCVLEKKPTPPWSLGNKIPSLVFCSRKFSAKTYPISIATK